MSNPSLEYQLKTCTSHILNASSHILIFFFTIYLSKVSSHKEDLINFILHFNAMYPYFFWPRVKIIFFFKFGFMNIGLYIIGKIINQYVKLWTVYHYKEIKTYSNSYLRVFLKILFCIDNLMCYLNIMNNIGIRFQYDKYLFFFSVAPVTSML